MKYLIIAIILLFGSLSAFAQIDTLWTRTYTEIGPVATTVRKITNDRYAMTQYTTSGQQIPNWTIAFRIVDEQDNTISMASKI